MRKVTKEIADAFCNRRSRKCGNTRTDGTTIWLFGNPIARHAENGEIEITLAGWDTVTTRERLNGVGNRRGFAVFRDRGVTKVSTRNLDYGAGAFTWEHAIEIPVDAWINPKSYAAQFEDK